MANGKAGAPKGNNNAGVGRQARRAQELALKHYGKENPPEVCSMIQTLMKLWQPLLDKAMIEGDLASMREINDRLDGKAVQALDVGPDTTVHFHLDYKSEG